MYLICFLAGCRAPSVFHCWLWPQDRVGQEETSWDTGWDQRWSSCKGDNLTVGSCSCIVVFSHSLELFICFASSVDEKAERVHELNEEIGKMLARAEQLGGEGNVDEAQKVLENVEKTRGLKKDAEVRN